MEHQQLNTSHVIGILALIVSTIAFFHYNASQTKDTKTLRILRNHHQSSSIECPNHFHVYHLTDNKNIFSIHVETKSGGKDVLRFCRKRQVGTRRGLQKNEEYARLGHVNKTIHKLAIRRACERFEYDKESKTPVIFDGKNKTEEPGSRSLLSGIYPGTLWCGVGNLANDIYSQLGPESETDKCCRAHDMCRPNIKPFESKFDQRNTGIASMSHCGCDVELYNCFRRQGNPVADQIADIFFNVLSMKCFEFGVKEICRWQILGLCIEYEKRCVAMMRDNEYY